MAPDDPINHPAHYTAHPSGVECIEITEHMGFCLGNAVKYLWRSGLKTDSATSAEASAIEDLKKARWYIDREISRLERQRVRRAKEIAERDHGSQETTCGPS